MFHLGVLASLVCHGTAYSLHPWGIRGPVAPPGCAGLLWWMEMLHHAGGDGAELEALPGWSRHLSGTSPGSQRLSSRCELGPRAPHAWQPGGLSPALCSTKDARVPGFADKSPPWQSFSI